jgi:hypothetical protein
MRTAHAVRFAHYQIHLSRFAGVGFSRQVARLMHRKSLIGTGEAFSVIQKRPARRPVF